MPEKVSLNQPPLGNIPKTAQRSSEINQKSHKSSVLKIILAVVVLGFLFVIAAGPWSPLLMFIQKSEYSALNVTDLKKSIPFYLTPDTKGWDYLSIADKFDGTSKVVYFFKPTNGDLSSSFGAKLTFPSQVTKEQIVEKFDETLKKANFEPEGKGLGQYCTKDNYVIGINAIDENGNTLFYGFQNQLGEEGKTSKIFQLGITSYTDSNARYAPSFCKKRN